MMESRELPTFPDDTTISGRLEALAKDKPDKLAFIFVDTAWNRNVLTRENVWDFSRRFAGVLHRLGVRKGEVVTNCLINSPERLLTSFGTIVSGAVPVQGQVLLADGEDFFHNLRKSQSTTVILDPGEKKGAYSILQSVKYTDKKTGKDCFEGLPHLTNIIQIKVCSSVENDGGEYETWLNGLLQEDFYENKDISSDDIARMFVTSGTTGFSKIVPHTHKSIREFGVRFAYAVGAFDERAVYFCDRSLGWIAGNPIVYPMIGSTRVLTNHRYGPPVDLGAFLKKLFQQENCDCAFIVPYHLQLILKSIEADGGQPSFKFRNIGTGGGPLPHGITKCLGYVTDAVTCVYGSTECGLMSTYVMRDRTDFKPLCSGKPIPGVEARIVDKNAEDVPVGQSGEVLFRSDMNTKEYLNDPEKTEAAILPGGWFKLGDIAYSDESGNLFVYSRKSDAIMRGAYLHYPGWMETRISNCPGVQGAVLVGVPDKILFEEICAFIVLAPGSSVTEESLRTYCDELFVSESNKEMKAVPKYFLFMDKFPTNQNGKILRHVLKEEGKRRLKF